MLWRKEHTFALVNLLTHCVEVWHFGDVDDINDSEVLDVLGDAW